MSPQTATRLYLERTRTVKSSSDIYNVINIGGNVS
jgi:hypothetical protein